MIYYQYRNNIYLLDSAYARFFRVISMKAFDCFYNSSSIDLSMANSLMKICHRYLMTTHYTPKPITQHNQHYLTFPKHHQTPTINQTNRVVRDSTLAVDVCGSVNPKKPCDHNPHTRIAK